MVKLPSIVKKITVSKLEETIGRKVKSGDFRYNYIRNLLSIEGLEIYEDNGEDIFVKFDSFDVNVDIIPLLKRKFYIKILTLLNPNFSLKYSDGVANFDSILKKIATDDKESEVKTESSNYIKSIELENITVDNFTFYYNDNLVQGTNKFTLETPKILYENKNFTNNVPKRDIDKFIRDVSESDVNCGIMCSENSGIANRNDLDIEILDGKPMIYLHNTKDNVDKIKIAIIILVNILQNNLELDTSMIQKIKDLVKETEEINKIYNSQKKHLNLMGEQNDKLVIHTRTIKYRLEEIISKCENSEFDERKQKCQHCSKFFMDLDKHIKKNHL